MTAKLLDDVMGLAQKESAHAGHFYIGVEHLFMALTRLEGGVTVGVLEDQGVAPRLARYMLRQELGPGDERRFWPGFRETPRLQAVLQIAQDLAEQSAREHLSERDLLLAILREGSSIPYRVLDGMGLDLDRMEVVAANWSVMQRAQPTRVSVQIQDQTVTLSDMEEEVLQQMFRGYERVVIERQLHGGYTSARVLVASPYQADGRAHASVVVKLDERQAILYEKLRYDSFVRDTLPPATARIVDHPVVPERSELGGLKYTFIRDPDSPGPVDLADYGRQQGAAALADLLRSSLNRVFGETWWSQRHLYQFGAWQEYEMVLPASLVIEVIPQKSKGVRRLAPLGQWSRLGQFKRGEIVVLEGFTVADFYPTRQAVQLTSGLGPDAQNRVGKVEVRGIPLPSREFFRGAVINQVVGRVLYTRDDLLFQQVADLDPDFDFGQDMLTLPHMERLLPNPVRRYHNLLQRRVAGSLSPIHGDLHLHNVLVGPGGNAWLIDFAQTREGHTLYDWAVLETSLLAEFVAPLIIGGAWPPVWEVAVMLAELAEGGRPGGSEAVSDALQTVAAVREIVQSYLADPDDWSEYWIALALCTLRGLRWTKTVSLQGRRLLFAASTVAMGLAAGKDSLSQTRSDTDMTDFNLDITDFSFGGVNESQE